MTQLDKWNKAIGYCDGAARGNPGPAGAGAVLTNLESGEVVSLGLFLGDTTNNVAEYQGLILLLEAAASRGVQDLEVRSDSELLVRQVNGIYRVKAPHLQTLFARVLELLKSFKRVRVAHVLRAANLEADVMSNRAIDERMAGDSFGE